MLMLLASSLFTLEVWRTKAQNEHCFEFAENIQIATSASLDH